jgi:alpha-beta hydrolase superfamily lysophospholipase
MRHSTCAFVEPYLTVINNEAFTFTGLEGLSIFCQVWRPEQEARAVLVIVHGYAEHSGRYRPAAEYFAGLGYVVYALDHRGCGHSDRVDGALADVIRFEDFVDDLKAFVGVVKNRERARRIFLIAHSMGGAIATLFVARHGPDIDGLVTSGVGVLLVGKTLPLILVLTRAIMRFIAPQLQIFPLPLRWISRDPKVVEGFQSDPMNYQGRVRARMLFQLLRAANLIVAEAANIRVPLLVLHGGGDRLINPKSSQMLFDQARSLDKNLKFYPGLYHEILNEPERREVLADITNWLERRQRLQD